MQPYYKTFWFWLTIAVCALALWSGSFLYQLIALVATVVFYVNHKEGF